MKEDKYWMRMTKNGMYELGNDERPNRFQRFMLRICFDIHWTDKGDCHFSRKEQDDD